MLTPITAMLILAFISVIGCGESEEDSASADLTAHESRHEEGGGEGEESGQEFAKNETYDEVRNGVRLKLAYDLATDTFVGTVENTTNQSLSRARVEVHLSNGIELGPTVPTDLEPGQKIDVELSAEGQDFTAWSAHPEIGNDEHGDGEHDEGDGEHGGGGHDRD